ncbi:MAG: anhydro-N-acetylmuramic acid kinase [Pseudomonadota bacterium]
MTLYIGLMSGTSLDGVDGVLVDIASAQGAPLTVRAHQHRPFDAEMRSELLALNTPGDNELQRSELAANALARVYAGVVQALLQSGAVAAHEVRAIGAHGQTVRHRPREFDGLGFTTQLLNGALLAELAGIDVVCDLRRRDVAAGGQGAPLAPGLHAALFAAPGESRAVLNLGGIANLTLLGSDGRVLGFDCGPANALLDGWCQRHVGQPFDDGGHWAATGRVIEPLLTRLLDEPFFALPPPKSTGRDLFRLAWLDEHLAHLARSAPAADVQATLAALTVRSVADALQRHAPETSLLMVCGGGARNGHLMRGLAARLPSMRVGTTAEFGLPVDQVEGAAFAWLAQRFVERLPGNVVTVTGARGERVLGALHPA